MMIDTKEQRLFLFLQGTLSPQELHLLEKEAKGDVAFERKMWLDELIVEVVCRRALKLEKMKQWDEEIRMRKLEEEVNHAHAKNAHIEEEYHHLSQKYEQKEQELAEERKQKNHLFHKFEQKEQELAEEKKQKNNDERILNELQQIRMMQEKAGQKEERPTTSWLMTVLRVGLELIAISTLLLTAVALVRSCGM